MSRTMVPCTLPARCGVSQHVVGSASHRECIAGREHSLPAAALPPVSAEESDYPEWMDALTEGYHDAGRVDGAWFDPGLAAGRCEVASTDFVAYARVHGHDAELVERLDSVVRGEHMAARVGEWVFDWTARQGDSSADVPEIIPFDEDLHRRSTGWSATIPPSTPVDLGTPGWAPQAPYDELSSEDIESLEMGAWWVKW